MNGYTVFFNHSSHGWSGGIGRRSVDPESLNQVAVGSAAVHDSKEDALSDIEKAIKNLEFEIDEVYYNGVRCKTKGDLLKKLDQVT